MPLETATNISQLDANNPVDGEGANFGDDHLRLIKAAIKGSFGAFDGSEDVTLTEAGINALPGDITTAVSDLRTELLGLIVPTGTIALWSGSIASIPTGWALCDGTNGTPNLRDRFVVGAGGTYAVGANDIPSGTTGDAGDHAHGGATAGHTLTIAQMPSHSHGLSGKEVYHKGGTEYDILANDGRQSTGTVLNGEGGGQAHSHNLGSSGDHSHSYDTRPPYYALAYIQKTASAA